MDYELRIIPDCPNSPLALELFRQSLAAENAVGDIRVVELDSEEQAEALDFHGSPSFIVGGRDLFPSTVPPALTCRIYPGVNGLTGLPSQEDLQAALRSAFPPREAFPEKLQRRPMRPNFASKLGRQGRHGK